VGAVACEFHAVASLSASGIILAVVTCCLGIVKGYLYLKMAAREAERRNLREVEVKGGSVRIVVKEEGPLIEQSCDEQPPPRESLSRIAVLISRVQARSKS
jgi:hypothetical protein